MSELAMHIDVIRGIREAAADAEGNLEIETVLGPVSASELGPTQMHEHLLLDYTPHRRQSKGQGDARELARWCERITLSNRHRARRDPHAYREAIQMSDVSEAVAAAMHFQEAGGDCLVDLTPPTLGQDPAGLQKVARATGLKIVMGTAFYTHPYHSEYEENVDPDRMTDRLISDIKIGIGENQVRPGIIGEVGLSYPLMPCEEKCLIACIAAQVETNLSLSIHPGRDPRSPFDIVDIVRRNGGDLSRTVIGHLDRTLFTIDDFTRLADSGCMLELDQFGMETWFAELSQLDLPSNAQRVKTLGQLCSRGYSHQLLIGQDIDNNMRRRSYGGEGYEHILNDVLPLMLERGISLTDLTEIMVINPRRVLGRRTAKDDSAFAWKAAATTASESTHADIGAERDE